VVPWRAVNSCELGGGPLPTALRKEGGLDGKWLVLLDLTGARLVGVGNTRVLLLVILPFWLMVPCHQEQWMATVVFAAIKSPEAPAPVC